MIHLLPYLRMDTQQVKHLETKQTSPAHPWKIRYNSYKYQAKNITITILLPSCTRERVQLGKSIMIRVCDHPLQLLGDTWPNASLGQGPG